MCVADVYLGLEVTSRYTANFSEYIDFRQRLCLRQSLRRDAYQH